MISTATPRDCVAYGTELVARARVDGIQLRLLGSVAVAIFVGERRFSSRPVAAKDVDCVAKKEDQAAIHLLFSRRNCRPANSLLLVAEHRETFVDTVRDMTIDVYYECIDGSHEVCIDLRRNDDCPCINIVELLLTKLQRHELREVDVWDIAELIKSHPAVDWSSFCRPLGRSWGLYATVTDNLKHICSRRRDVEGLLSSLLQAAQQSRKSIRWYLRAAVGRHWRWWREMYTSQVVAR